MAVLLAGAVACRGRETTVTPGSGQFRGVEMPRPRPLPAAVLTATDGRPYDVARETAGHPTLLFFGYTHCPDVCPVHLANIAAALRKLSPSDGDRLRVLFVTTDPERDSLPVIRRWLDQFDPRFIGLRGPLSDVNRLQAALGLPPAIVTRDPATGQVDVGHAAFVLAIDRAGMARLMYPFGTRQADWAHDLPILLDAQWDTTAASRSVTPAFATAPPVAAGALTISQAVVTQAAPGTSAAAYFRVENRGADPDVLLGVEVAGGAPAMLHLAETDGAGRLHMTMLDSMPIPPGGTLTLRPGAAHAMLAPIRTTIPTGEVMALRLRFRRAGAVGVPATVVPTDAVDATLAPSGGR